jgi:hypothetical protein
MPCRTCHCGTKQSARCITEMSIRNSASKTKIKMGSQGTIAVSLYYRLRCTTSWEECKHNSKQIPQLQKTMVLHLLPALHSSVQWFFWRWRLRKNNKCTEKREREILTQDIIVLPAKKCVFYFTPLNAEEIKTQNSSCKPLDLVHFTITLE